MTDHQLKDSHLLKDSGKGPRTAPAEVPNFLANNSVSVKLHLLNCIAFMLQKNRLWFYLREPQIGCKKQLWHPEQHGEESEATWRLYLHPG